MSFRTFNNHQTLQSYPKIQIDWGHVMKPCVADQAAADQFLEKPIPTWRRVFHDVWHEGIPFILRYLSSIKVPANANVYYGYLIRVVRYLALILLHIHRVYLYIYGYFYPYSLMSYDEVSNEFCRAQNWRESVIRAFAWHPTQNRCAIAICNDHIDVYQGPTRIRILRHNQQRKITDLAWHPVDKDVLAVATQTHIILWRISDTPGVPSDVTRNKGLNQLIQRLDLTRRPTESLTNGAAKSESRNGHLESLQSSQANQSKHFRILDALLPGPIVRIQFEQGGHLYACSPNSSKIAVIDVEGLFGATSISDKTDHHVKYLRKYGQGVTQIMWSPERDRLATATTSSFVRVFEPFKWSCSKWSTRGNVIQDMVWSRPSGRMLLIANKAEPFLYALPFLDKPQANDVGGNKSLMKALDLSATDGEHGSQVGGRIQSFAWDSSGRRLAISFKDNADSILLYKTVERPTVEFHQLGVIRSEKGGSAVLMEFHDKFSNGCLLTICWSDGNVQHVPLNMTPQETTKSTAARDDSFNNSANVSRASLREVNSPAKTPRSLTNFWHISGNNSISSSGLSNLCE